MRLVGNLKPKRRRKREFDFDFETPTPSLRDLRQAVRDGLAPDLLHARIDYAKRCITNELGCAVEDISALYLLGG